MGYTYECSICDRTLILSSFYMCSNSHICCDRCYSCTSQNSCQLCGQGQVYCREVSKYRSDETNHLLFRKTNGPIVVFPLSKVVVRLSPEDSGNHCCSDEANPCLPWHHKIMKCLDCRKCIFMSRVLEHYICEHKETLVCPVPLGSMITFQLISKNIEIGKVNNLQLLQLMDVAGKNSSFEEEETTLEGNEKLLFVMGAKLSLQLTASQSVNIVKLWVFATFHACTINYSIEVTGTRNNSMSIIFTGVPINASSVDVAFQRNFSSVQVADFNHGQVLSVRESLLQHFEEEGCCTASIYIHHNDLLD